MNLMFFVNLAEFSDFSRFPNFWASGGGPGGTRNGRKIGGILGFLEIEKSQKPYIILAYFHKYDRYILRYINKTGS